MTADNNYFLYLHPSAMTISIFYFQNKNILTALSLFVFKVPVHNFNEKDVLRNNRYKSVLRVILSFQNDMFQARCCFASLPYMITNNRLYYCKKVKYRFFMIIFLFAIYLSFYNTFFSDRIFQSNHLRTSGHQIK